MEKTGCREKGKVEVCIWVRWESDGEKRGLGETANGGSGVLFWRFAKNNLGFKINVRIGFLVKKKYRKWGGTLGKERATKL